MSKEVFGIKGFIKRIIASVEKTSKGRVLVQFVKFGMVGISNTLISLAATYALLFVFKFCFKTDTTWSLNVSTLFGFIVGVCNSYHWNNRYVFKNKKESNEKKAFAKVTVCYGITYLISMVLMDILVEFCHIPSLIAPIPRLIFTIPLNFILNKLWAFKDR